MTALDAQAQSNNTGVLRGTVVDSVTNKPIGGASIRLDNSGRGTSTDALGGFRLEVPPGTYLLRTSYLGFQTTAVPMTVRAGETTPVTFGLRTAALNLSEVTVTQNPDLNQSLSVIARVDRELRPVQSAQDLLRLVPGLFIAQHAGGGKAEQIFVRGFDADHGTDFAVSIDGIPVNMVSHAHGQGYADFHFVIPETVESLNVYKGPYSARFGDFATAGAGDFTTKNGIKQSVARVEVGQFDTYRGLAMVDLLHGNHLFSKRKESAYVAAEYYFTNAYFNAPQHFKRFNGFAKYNGLLSEHTSLTLIGSHFNSKWNASGQVPERGVDSGLISRFGSIDNSEGGHTDRTNASAKLTTVLPNDAVITNLAFYSNYHFNLFSNFTFFLNNPEQGDEIRQQETGRDIYGYDGTYEQSTALGAHTLKTTFGAGTRLDDAGLGLYHAEKRVTLDTVSVAHLYEQNVHTYVDEVFSLTDKLTLNTAVRYDHFFFKVRNKRNAAADSISGRADKGIFSPKLNLYYNVSDGVQLFIRSGTGFHSNDARGVVRATTQRILPRAYGSEVGSTFKMGPRVLVNLVFWGLQLQNELVYVGDEGVVEITGRTRRFGTDLSVRAQLTNALYFDADLNLSRGRYLDEPKGADRIPLAPNVTSTGGITWRQGASLESGRNQGFSGAVRYRAIDSRAANETNTVRAKGYVVTDVVASYSWSRFQLGFTIENLLNVKWNQAQFDTQSRLPGEGADGVSELHFTPGTPFYLKGNASVYF